MWNSGKTVLVTGGDGFIGSHLCARLAKEGYHVISLDNHLSGSKEHRVSGVEYREGHTKDIEQLVPETNIDLIYHLGEYARVEVSLTEPDVVWDSNMLGTFRVLEFWRKRNLSLAGQGGQKCKLIYAGSSTKFGDGGLGRDQSPYAWTKAVNTELVRNYGTWYGLPYAITYFYNVYGPGERAGKYGTVIEIFRQLYLSGKPLTVNSPGTQQRVFTHVDDIVDGLILIGEKGEGDEFGLGADQAYSILDIARMFGTSIEMRPEVKGNRMNSKLDTVRSHTLGWTATRRVEDYIHSISKAA